MRAINLLFTNVTQGQTYNWKLCRYVPLLIKKQIRWIKEILFSCEGHQKKAVIFDSKSFLWIKMKYLVSCQVFQTKVILWTSGHETAILKRKKIVTATSHVIIFSVIFSRFLIHAYFTQLSF